MKHFRTAAFVLTAVSWAALTPAESARAQPRPPKTKGGERPDTRELPLPARPLPFRSVQAARITQVVRNGPAERAGLRRGQVILSVNGRGITRIEDLDRALRGSRRAQLEVASLTGRIVGETSYVTVEPSNGKAGLYAEMTTVRRTFGGTLEDADGPRPKGMKR